MQRKPKFSFGAVLFRTDCYRVSKSGLDGLARIRLVSAMFAKTDINEAVG